MNPYPLFKSLAFRMDPETVHERTLKLLRRTARPGRPHWMAGKVEDCPVEVMGLRFRNPVGLAAGMDKNASCVDGFASLGFGFLEVGTVTPRPQPGNPKPRLFRLPEHEGIINRMGFNNDGVDALLANLKDCSFAGPLGINIGKNFDTPMERASSDYISCLEKVYARADYIAVNISSPNTSNLRDLQEGQAFSSLLRDLADCRARLEQELQVRKPIAVKIAPDLQGEQIDFIVEALLEHGMDAVIATNTTLSREKVLGHPHAEERGGLSGAPVREASTAVIQSLAGKLQGALPIIGVGGIFSAEDAREKLNAGASLLQVYSGLIYRGPGLVSELVKGCRPCG